MTTSEISRSGYESGSIVERFFYALLSARWIILIASLGAIVAFATQLPNLTRDTRIDAFISQDHPALLRRDATNELFGLKDSLAVAIVTEAEHGVFEPETLALVHWLTDEINKLPNIDETSTISLATENNIVGTADGMIVEAMLAGESEIYQSPAGTPARAEEIRAAIALLPLYQGNLVARDGRATLIVSDIIDVQLAAGTYEAVLELSERAPKPQAVEIHVAGEAAVSGYLTTYIANDTRRLVPLTVVMIAVFLSVCFMRFVVTPLVVLGGSVAITFGLMAAMGVPFFVITNGLLANLLGIAVADAIHILSQHQEEIRREPNASKRRLAARAVSNMWRPVTLTTLTTMGGFLALFFASDLPPLQYYGLYGAIGVGVAWLLSITALPAAMSIAPVKLGRPFRKEKSGENSDASSRMMRALGSGVLAAPRLVIVLAFSLLAVGGWGASQVTINERSIENFNPSEPIVLADRTINSIMDGAYFLDVVVETPEKDDLHKPENLRKLEELQAFLESLPHVSGSFSIAESVRLMHRAVNEDRPEAYVIPDDAFLISQLYLLYSASASPTDFEEQIDSNYQRALVRAYADEGQYLTNKELFPAIDRYLSEKFNTDEIKGLPTGRLHVDYNLISLIQSNHVISVVLAMLAVYAMAAIVFRSFLGGLLAVLPVTVGVAVVYAIMGFGGIWVGIGTSMFAAIAIGLGVDFAIHTLDRLRDLVREAGFSRESLLKLYPNTGRALFFNFLAVGGAFGVLFLSDVPPLLRFGLLVAAAVTAAFVASMTLLPALVITLKPAFLTRGEL